MKQYIKYLMVAVLVALLPTASFAGDGRYEFGNKNDFSVTYDPSTYTFSCQFMVDANAAYNGWLSYANPGELQISHDKSNWTTVAQFWGLNYDHPSDDQLNSSDPSVNTYVKYVNTSYGGSITLTPFNAKMDCSETISSKLDTATMKSWANYLCGGSWSNNITDHCNYAAKANFTYQIDAAKFDTDKNIHVRVVVHAQRFGSYNAPEYTHELYDGTVENHLVTPTVVTPYEDLSLGVADAGKMTVTYTLGQKPVSAMLYVGSESYNLISLNGYATDGTVLINPQETATDAHIEAKYTVTGSSEISRTSKYVTVSPYKSINSTIGVTEYSVSADDKTQTPLARFGGNKITWEMNNPTEDIFSSDQFLILRGYKSDYSDLQTISSIALTGFDSMDGNNAIYSYVDEASNESAFNTEDTITSTATPKIYYAVARATAYSSWDINAANYARKTVVEKTHGLPDVTKVTVVKEDTVNYKTNHRVKIRIEMADHSSLFDHCIWNADASIVLQRRNISNGPGDKDVTIDGSMVKWDSTNGVYYVETTDVIDYELNQFTYYAQVKNGTTYLRSNPNPVRCMTESDTKCLVYSLAADMRDLYASTDQYDQITVSWPVPTGLVSTGKLERREVTEDGIPVEEWTELSKFNWKSGEYIDEDINIHHFYQYKATLSYTSSGQTATCETTNPPIGHQNNFGKITGRVATANGMGVAGVKVQIVKADDNSQMYLTWTDASGSYAKDSIAIDGDFSNYIVEPTSDGTISYVYTENGVSPQYTATLGNGKTFHSSVDFRPATDYRINGRVLYDGTTVPVEHANFKLNGNYLYKSAGTLVETDGKGDFSFTLPAGVQIDSLQVVKKGHTFKTNGCVKNKEDKTSFQLSASIESIQLHDMTKTRLAGRIAGGYVQQAKPLGFGLSKNNIGDSICVIMQLEGDNSAYLVYNEKDLNQKTRVDTAVTYNKKDTTVVNVERKRMVVNVNKKTGEFFVDLLPVKYKITAITAKGYGSLFNKGMVSPVIDMTDSLTTHIYTYNDSSNIKKTGVVVKDTTAYNNAYNYAYHSGINITYTQMISAKYGDLPYLGEEKIIYSDIDGRKTTLNLAEKDTLGVYHYALGHPLFIENKTYYIKGRAHEDYYYNNDKNMTLDQVPVTMGTMVVDNGLTAKNTTLKYSLDSNGSCITTFVAGNQLFTQTGEKALGQFNMSLDIDGNYFDAEELQAFVTGTRSQTTGVNTCATDTACNIQLLDILRDPPGAKSFASIAAGTKWDMTYKLDFSASFAFNFNITRTSGANTFVGTVSAPEGVGTVNGYSYQQTSTNSYDIPIPIYTGSYSESYTYSLTSNETISTSSEATDCGAMSDVFIGATQNMQYSTKDVISVVDSTAYARLLPAITGKDITLIQKGKQADGTTFYLVRAEQFTASMTYPVMFNYTARHIYNHILPNLVKARSELVKKMDAATAQAMADASHQPVYYTSKDNWDIQEKLATDTVADYQIAWPEGTKVGFDQVAGYTRAIKAWIKILLKNERDKVNAFQNLQSYKTTHSISAGTTYSYTQGESDSDASKELPYYASATTAGISIASKAASAATKNVNEALKQLSKQIKSALKTDKTSAAEKMLSSIRKTMMENDLNGKDQTEGTDVKTPSASFSYLLTPSIDVSFSSSSTKNLVNNRTRSYTLGVSDDSYMDIEVYKTCVDTTITGYAELLKAYQKCYGSSVDNNVFLNNYIFREVGGATRNPWQDADSTIWYINESNFKPYPLAVRTLKIDNPVLTINEPEINNVLPDQAAYFTIRMSNESELGSNIQLTKGSSLTLSVVPGTNPHGAQIYIDGAPLSTGITYSIKPNTQLTKTMTVMRGTGFDYNDLQLKLSSADGTTSSIVNFSVHYVPASSPVAIVTPGDKWVLNTLNPKDESGYYMPITVSGYDVNYAGFDHIEMQYKQHKQGDTGWTNLCSYYANDSIYQKANGTKQMIKSGTISNFRFYGEMDPVEMEYDIRAVAYSRNGTEFVTNSSDIISGMKDTRCPEVFGKPQPADGILYYTDNIELPFTENIAYNYLDETNNFSIEGYTNNTAINEGRTLYFPGTSDQYAKSLVDRNLTDRSFSIDMMVKLDNAKTKMTFFTHKVGNKSKIKFGINADQHLFATIGNTTVVSDSVVKHADEGLHSVGLVCQKVDSIMKVSFFYGNELFQAANNKLSSVYSGVGPVYFGVDAVDPDDAPFKGNMLNIRLWNKALDESTIAQFQGKLLNGYQTMLKGYWPLTDSKGDVASDVVAGANLSLNATSWQTSTKFSLKLDNQVIKMESAVMQAASTQDYSIGFWFRTADNFTPDDSKYVNIFGIGNSDNPVKGTGGMRIGFYKGNFILRTGGQDYTIAQTSTVADAQWHSYMMTVSPSMATASVYLDDELMAKPLTDDLDGIASSGARFGGDGFSGNIDMFTHWYMALSKSFMSDIADRMLTGREQSLNVYLPFTHQETNDQGLYRGVFSPYNEKITETVDADGNTVIKDRTLMLTEYADANVDNSLFSPMAASHEYKKIPFKWTSTNTSLIINLNIPDKEIDKQNIYLTVRDVEDLQGNPLQNPISWSIYPDLTRLRWDKRYMTHAKAYGATETMEFEWSNNSGKDINYSITTTSSRITLGTTDGIAHPTSNHTLKVTLSDQMPIGTYDELIYINDLDNGLTEPLRITFTVSATEPEWAVTTDASYNQTMNVVGRVSQYDSKGRRYIDSNQKDIVAAFNGDICLGKTYISSTESYNETNLFLTVKGKTVLDASGSVTKMPVTFMLWNSQTNKTSILAVYDSENKEQETTFSNNAIMGVPTPLDMRTTNYIQQFIDLKQGWNWISFNVKPLDADKGPNNFLYAPEGFGDGDMFSLVGSNEFYTYNANTRSWEGKADANMQNSNSVYQYYANKDVTATIRGIAYDDTDRYVVVNVPKAYGWSQLANLIDSKQTLNIALCDFAIGDKCPVNSVIKSYDKFAVAVANSRWQGSLEYMIPGEGYFVRTATAINDTIRYFNTATTEAKGTIGDDDADSGLTNFTSLMDREYNTSMPVIATFADGSAMAGDAVVAYVDGKVAGVAEYNTDDNLFYLSVNASAGSLVKFAKVRAGKIEGVTTTSVDYNSNIVVGTIDEPLKLAFTTTGIDNLKLEDGDHDMYDVAGRKYHEYQDVKKRKGVFIIDGNKIAR